MIKINEIEFYDLDLPAIEGFEVSDLPDIDLDNLPDLDLLEFDDLDFTNYDLDLSSLSFDLDCL